MMEQYRGNCHCRAYGETPVPVDGLRLWLDAGNGLTTGSMAWSAVGRIKAISGMTLD